MTNLVGLDFSAVVAHGLQKLLDLGDETWKKSAGGKLRNRQDGQTDVKYWRGKLNVTEMSRTFLWTFFTSLAVVLTVDCAEARVVDTLGPRPLTLFILSRH
jgi:hypothetical protein